jgi:hypothetical protein
MNAKRKSQSGHSPEFKAKQFKSKDGTTEPLAEKILAVRVSVGVDQAVRSLPDRATWLRRVISEAAQRELMKENGP